MKFRDIYHGSERRKHVRLEQTLTAEFVFIDQMRSVELSQKRSGTLLNISAGGVCLETDQLNEAWKDDLLLGGIKVALEIKLPKTEKVINALSKVVWLSKLWKQEKGKNLPEKYLSGLEFIDITTAAQDAIKEFVIESYMEKKDTNE